MAGGGDFFRGFMQGFAPVVASSITQRAEQERQKIQEETDFLQRKTLDPNASQAERDAALYALTQLASSKKPGKGFQAFEKKVKEATAAEVSGAQGPYGMVAGQEGAPTAGASGSPSPSAGGPPPPGSAALPSTSPVAQTGSAMEGPGPDAQTTASLMSRPPDVTVAATEEGPPPPPSPGAAGAAATAGTTEQDLLAKGAELGMTPPERTPRPEAPNRYTARKLDLDFYKQEMLEHKAAEERYVDYLNRIAQLVYQEKKQKETQAFEKSEREATQTFKASESEKERKSDETQARIRKGEADSAASKEATLRERQALAAYRRDLQQIERDKGKPSYEGGLKGPTGVDQAEVDRRTKAAAEIYEMATGQPAPPVGGGGEGPPKLELPPGQKAFKTVRGEGPPPPPARASDLDRLPAGPKIRSIIEGLRRGKMTPEQICAKIQSSPSLDEQSRAAARAYARCPEK